MISQFVVFPLPSLPFHGLYCSVRIEVIALACLFSGECLVVTCVVVLESVFLQILAAAVSYGYSVCVVCF